jgi:hypothetical protein
VVMPVCKRRWSNLSSVQLRQSSPCQSAASSPQAQTSQPHRWRGWSNQIRRTSSASEIPRPSS